MESLEDGLEQTEGWVPPTSRDGLWVSMTANEWCPPESCESLFLC
jgi:hypothetical protein